MILSSLRSWLCGGGRFAAPEKEMYQAMQQLVLPVTYFTSAYENTRSQQKLRPQGHKAILKSSFSSIFKKPAITAEIMCKSE